MQPPPIRDEGNEGNTVSQSSSDNPNFATLSPIQGQVGRIAGTEDSTPLLFSVALQPDAYLQLDDVVVTVRVVPGVGPVMTAGIVTEVTARHEGASFGSDVFLISD